MVGGGASAVQLLGESAPVTDTLWVTRRPPASVVSVTGLALREQECVASLLGAYERRAMFAAIEPDGVRWADGSTRTAT